MPCYMTGSAEGDARLAADEARAQVTKLTEILCAQMRALEKVDPGLIHKSAKAWWEEHKKIDAQRRTELEYMADRMRRKGQILKKLTDEECEILGIK